MAPVYFIGHGSPMNALATNAYTAALAKLGASYPHPKGVLCVSAHWTTQGTWVTHMAKPKTIHDFYGFPKELFAIEYPAPGCPEVAERIRTVVSVTPIQFDDEKWGLDHGTWSVLRHIYPAANVPVVQLSLDLAQPPDFHFKVGQQLAALRDEGVLIVGSGNIVHNLRTIRWEADAPPTPWATQFDDWCKAKIVARDFSAILHDWSALESGRLSVPTTEHFLPLCYTLGAAADTDGLEFVHEEIQNSSISMRSIRFARKL